MTTNDLINGEDDVMAIFKTMRKMRKGDKGDKGDKGAMGIMGWEGKNGKDGKDGKDGATGKTGPKGPKGDSSIVDVKPVALEVLTKHEKKFDHSLIDPFLIGSKKINEKNLEDGKFLRYDAKSDKLVYSTIRDLSEASRKHLYLSAGIGIPVQSGNNGKYLTTDGSNLSWATVAGGGAVASDVIWTAKGDLAAGTGVSTAAVLAVGTNGQILTADSTQATGVKWSSAGGAGITRSISSISSPVTAGSTASVDYVYFVSGTTTLTLPTAVGNANRYTVKNTGVAIVTIATTSAQTIDGSTTVQLKVVNTTLEMISDNANWRII